MSYLVLARRWRPQSFDEVLAQRHVTQTLQNAISTDRVAHAFIFSGPRGVGKTTVARILSKALNCRQGPTPTPCGSCDVCSEIAAGICTDVQEIDGASNTSVEHVRNLRENILYRPSKGRYKIYIIDEVHMLSTPAFNALLKTLEEPPPHVKFIFATTEPQKIPVTILSRCQRFEFKRIPWAVIVDQLKRICGNEGIEASEAVLGQIARHAQGSLRDAQSLFDQVISYAGQSITEQDLRDVLGVLDRQWLVRTTDALLRRDAKGCLEIVDELFQHGQSLTYFYHQLVEHIRNVMVVKVAQGAQDLLHLSDDEMEALERQASSVDEEDLHLWFDLLVEVEEEVRRSPYPRYVLEMVLLKMATVDRVEDLHALVDQLEDVQVGPSGHRPQEVGKPKTESKELTPRGPQQGDFQVQFQRWERFLDELRKRRPAMASILEQGRLKGTNRRGELIIELPSQFHVELLGREDHQREIRALFKEVWDRDGGVHPVLMETGEGQREKNGNTRHLKRVEVRSHPLVQETLELFQGQLVDIILPEGKE